MCNIFESPLTLAVAKPPHHSPTCRPPPSRDTPHTHWTLLQRDLPIEHQRTYQPHTSAQRTSSIPSPFSLVSIPQYQARSRNDPPRVQDAFRSPHTHQQLITPCSTKPGSYSSHNTACTTTTAAHRIRRFLLVFYAICTRNFSINRFCACLCVEAIA